MVSFNYIIKKRKKAKTVNWSNLKRKGDNDNQKKNERFSKEKYIKLNFKIVQY